jgi:hypothetical protein
MNLAAQDLDYLRAIIARNSGNHLNASQDHLFESLAAAEPHPWIPVSESSGSVLTPNVVWYRPLSVS